MFKNLLTQKWFTSLTASCFLTVVYSLGFKDTLVIC